MAKEIIDKDDSFHLIKDTELKRLWFNIILGGILGIFVFAGFLMEDRELVPFLKRFLRGHYVELGVMFLFYNALLFILYGMQKAEYKKSGKYLSAEKRGKIFRGILLGCIIHIVYKSYLWAN